MSSFFDRSTVISPEQLDVMQGVFDDISAETWFLDTVENRERLAGIVLHTFRAGKTDEFELLDACHEIARAQFRR